MPTIINFTSQPKVLVCSSGKRVTIPAGKGTFVEGDFTAHPWVVKGWLEIAKDNAETGPQNNTEADPELVTLREQYLAIFGKKAHPRSGKEKLREEIEKWRQESD